MDNKVKAIIGVAILAVGVIGFNTVSKELKKDPVVTGIEAEFVGEVAPGEVFTKKMFSVKGITNSGKLINLNNFSSKTEAAAKNGATCEVDIESQGYTDTVIVNITREPVMQRNIGYPKEEDATVTCYANGDLEFTGKGDITNFNNKDIPWRRSDYTHVYIDDSLAIENMDEWFISNDDLVYCSAIPKTVKTMKKTFAKCTALESTPDYFQCSNLKIMDYAFSGCESLKEADILPVNVSSARYTFEGCASLQKPVSLDKTSNLVNINGLYNGCINLREPTQIPDTVTSMRECYKGCINIKEAVKFPINIQDASSAYENDSALVTGATIPEAVSDFSNCYSGCSALSGSLEINSDSSSFSGVLRGATTNGDKLTISGNSGNLLAIQKDSGNSNISLADPEAASKQNERMLREQEGEY